MFQYHLLNFLPMPQSMVQPPFISFHLTWFIFPLAMLYDRCSCFTFHLIPSVTILTTQYLTIHHSKHDVPQCNHFTIMCPCPSYQTLITGTLPMLSSPLYIGTLYLAWNLCYMLTGPFIPYSKGTIIGEQCTHPCRLRMNKLRALQSNQPFSLNVTP